MNLKYDQLLSNFAFNFNLRPYNVGARVHQRAPSRAVQLDPGFEHLTPRLLSGTFRHFRHFRGFQLLKLKYDKLLSNFAVFQLQPAPLHPGRVGPSAGGGGGGAEVGRCRLNSA